MPARPPRIDGGAIVLAAGRGVRFGADKRRAVLPSGLSLLAATVRRYAEAFDQLLVMLRAGDTALAELLTPHLALPGQRLGYSARAAGGMGCTLADAITQVPDAWQFAFVALGDMPFVTYTTLRRLQWTMARPGSARARIVQPCHAGEPGHPVAFTRAFFPALAALDADQGARSVVQANQAAVQRVDIGDAGIVADVDTPAALTASRAPTGSPR